MNRWFGFVLMIMIPCLATAAMAREAWRPDPDAVRLRAPVCMKRIQEPREQAFSLLVPDGWHVAGGIRRVTPDEVGGQAQSLEAKIDMTIRSPAAPAIELRAAPDWYYIDTRTHPAHGMFPEGSSMNGATVMPVMGAADFLERIVFPGERRDARAARVVARRDFPELRERYAAGARRLAQALGAMGLPDTSSVDAAIVEWRYELNGVAYRELGATVVHDLGAAAAGMWVNRETRLFRAPVEHFDHWMAVLGVMVHSIELNPRWVHGEVQGQIRRGQIMARNDAEVRRIEQEMLDHQRRTNAEIHNDMFLTLTGQEEYVNPWNGEVERVPELSPDRWVTSGGDVIYAPDDGFDPNMDGRFNGQEWKRTPVRPR